MRVLVIDDDKAVGHTVKLWLEANGADVHYAESALAGIAALKGAHFDLAMIDIVMPVVGGIETIKLVRQATPNLPIIAMSGYLDYDNQTKDFRRPGAGSIYTLAKPFRSADLAKALKACLGRSLADAMKASGTEPERKRVRKATRRAR